MGRFAQGENFDVRMERPQLTFVFNFFQANGISPQAYSSPQEAEREVETLIKVFEATATGGEVPVGKVKDWKRCPL